MDHDGDNRSRRRRKWFTLKSAGLLGSVLRKKFGRRRRRGKTSGRDKGQEDEEREEKAAPATVEHNEEATYVTPQHHQEAGTSDSTPSIPAAPIKVPPTSSTDCPANILKKNETVAEAAAARPQKGASTRKQHQPLGKKRRYKQKAIALGGYIPLKPEELEIIYGLGPDEVSSRIPYPTSSTAATATSATITTLSTITQSANLKKNNSNQPSVPLPQTLKQRRSLPTYEAITITPNPLHAPSPLPFPVTTTPTRISHQPAPTPTPTPTAINQSVDATTTATRGTISNVPGRSSSTSQSLLLQNQKEEYHNAYYVSSDDDFISSAGSYNSSMDTPPELHYAMKAIPPQKPIPPPRTTVNKGVSAPAPATTAGTIGSAPGKRSSNPRLSWQNQKEKEKAEYHNINTSSNDDSISSAGSQNSTTKVNVDIKGLLPHQPLPPPETTINKGMNTTVAPAPATTAPATAAAQPATITRGTISYTPGMSSSMPQLRLQKEDNEIGKEGLYHSVHTSSYDDGDSVSSAGSHSTTPELKFAMKGLLSATASLRLSLATARAVNKLRGKLATHQLRQRLKEHAMEMKKKQEEEEEETVEEEDTVEEEEEMVVVVEEDDTVEEKMSEHGEEKVKEKKQAGPSAAPPSQPPPPPKKKKKKFVYRPGYMTSKQTRKSLRWELKNKLNEDDVSKARLKRVPKKLRTDSSTWVNKDHPYMRELRDIQATVLPLWRKDTYDYWI